MLKRCLVITIVFVAHVQLMADPLVLDQEWTTSAPHFSGNVGGGYLDLGQTIEAGLTGYLTALEFHVFCPDGFGNMTLSIRNVAGGRPGNTILTTETFSTSVFPAGTVPGWGRLTLSSPVWFASGDRFAVVVEGDPFSGEPPFCLSTAVGDDPYQGYPDGSLYWFAPDRGQWDRLNLDPHQDIYFRTFVEVPEPSALCLLTCAGLWPLRRRRIST